MAAAPISRSTHSSLVAVLLLACFVHLVWSSPERAQDTVRSTCKRLAAGDPTFALDLCIKTLSLDPRSQTADLYGLGLIALESELESFNQAVFHIKELLKKKWDKPTVLALKTCSNMYKKLATDDWGQLAKAFEQEDYAQAKDYAKSQLGWPKECENEFTTERPLTEQNDQVSDICYIALKFVLLLAKWTTMFENNNN